MNFKEINEIQKILKDIFPQFLYENKPNDSILTFYRIGKKQKKFIQTTDIYDFDKLSNHIKNLDKRDLAVTFNTTFNYKNRKSSLYSINSIVIDIDFTKLNLTYDAVMFYLENDHFNKDIPIPSYIERSHNMRLIYVLQEPVYLAKRKDYINFVQFVSNYLTKNLEYLGADTQIINSYIRLPYSVNTKDGNVVTYEHYSDVKYTFQEIVDGFLPELPSWYLTKKSLKKKKKKVSGFTNHNHLVLQDLEKIQSYFNTIENSGHREVMCFLYRNYCILAGYSREEAQEKMLDFNNNWNVPIQEHKIISNTNNVNYKTYLYKNETMLDTLGLRADILDLSALNSDNQDRKEYFHTYYENNKKSNKQETRKNKIKKLILTFKQKMKTNLEIVKLLKKHKIDLSIKSVERYVGVLIKENLYSPT